MEGFLSTRSNFLSETAFRGAIEQIGKVLAKGVSAINELTSHVSASTAGFLMAIGLNTTQAGLGTALSYSINGRFLVPKSWVSSILIPHILDFNASVRTEKIIQIGTFLGENIEGLSAEEASSRIIESLRSLIGNLDLPTRLRDFDLELAEMADIVEIAHSFDMIGFQPRTVASEDIYDIIKAAF
jgi:alcohol dehydrogenase